MKKLMTLALLTISMPAMAASITIQPGTTITVAADTTTSISCMGQSNGSDHSKATCFCQYNTHANAYDARMLINGTNQYMSTFEVQAECLSFLAKTPSCN